MNENSRQVELERKKAEQQKKAEAEKSKLVVERAEKDAIMATGHNGEGGGSHLQRSTSSLRDRQRKSATVSSVSAGLSRRRFSQIEADLRSANGQASASLDDQHAGRPTSPGPANGNGLQSRESTEKQDMDGSEDSDWDQELEARRVPSGEGEGSGVAKVRLQRHGPDWRETRKVISTKNSREQWRPGEGGGAESAQSGKLAGVRPRRPAGMKRREGSEMDAVDRPIASAEAQTEAGSLGTVSSAEPQPSQN